GVGAGIARAFAEAGAQVLTCARRPPEVPLPGEDGCTTSEVARRVGVTPSTASEHVGILREAGLAASVRDRNTVLHVLTPLGASLLTANGCGRE
ncbi:ArsR family transcriptional regulator, partial [Streptomyces nigra]